MRPNDADEMTNRDDPDQTAPSDLGLHCLLRPICPNIESFKVPAGIQHVYKNGQNLW